MLVMLGRLIATYFGLACVQIFADQSVGIAQTQPENCVLEGTAVDFITTEPLRKAAVHLVPVSAPGSPGFMGITDPSGQFHFEGVPEGEYDLTGERTGYLKSEFGAKRPGGTGTTLRLKAGDKLTNLTIKMVRRSVIAGTVSDDSGQPVMSALVFAVSQSWLGGKQFYDTSYGVWTNDEGDYRIIDLTPGPYYLCAGRSSGSFVEKQGGPEKRMVSTCYPGSRTPVGAAKLEVQAGQSLQGINIRLPAEAVFHIRGRFNSTSSQDRDQRISLEAHPQNVSSDVSALDEETRKDGTFDFSGATVGRYDIDAVSEEHQIVAKLSVEVKNSDVNGLVLSAPSRLDLSGTVHLLNADSDAHTPLQVFARDLDTPGMSHPYQSEVASDGTFKMENLWPGRYIIGLSAENQGQYIKSIRSGGREALGAPVVLTSTGTQVEIVVGGDAGRVDGSIQASDSDANVGGLEAVLTSESPRLDDEGLRLAKTDRDGHFSFKRVPPGRYYAFATGDADPELLENRDFVAQLQQSGLEVELPANGKLQIRIPILPSDDVRRALSAVGP
jgi:hypothetical protein